MIAACGMHNAIAIDFICNCYITPVANSTGAARMRETATMVTFQKVVTEYLSRPFFLLTREWYCTK
jgi:hypothetical protein